MSLRRVGGVALLFLSGCARPNVGKDTVDPEAAKLPPPVAASTTATTTTTTTAPPPKPDNATPLAKDQPLVVTVPPTDDQRRTATLVQVDRETPMTVPATDEEVTVNQLDAGIHILRLVPIDGDDGLNLEPGTLKVWAFQVGDEAKGNEGFDKAGPLLTVGQPIGELKLAEDGAVPLDIRVDNLTIGAAGPQVKWSVDGGEAHSVAEYPPAEPLTMGPFEPGKHQLAVWLQNTDGTLVENGGYTRVDREFTVPPPQ